MNTEGGVFTNAFHELVGGPVAKAQAKDAAPRVAPHHGDDVAGVADLQYDERPLRQRRQQVQQQKKTRYNTTSMFIDLFISMKRFL